jgi:muconate cycloisomerase
MPCVYPISTPAEHQRGQVAGIYYTDDLLVAPMQFRDGAIEVPDAPGMGIQPDLQKIDRYTTGSPIVCTR